MNRTILAVVAHPDDEVLGVGGTLAMHAKNGDDVSVLILADGETSRGPVDQEQIAERAIAAKKACAILGVSNVYFDSFPDNKMDTVACLDIVQSIEPHIESIKPDIIYTHHGGDLNIDHRIVFQAVMTASRPIKGNQYPKKIFGFETLSSTEWGVHEAFIPTVYKNIKDAMDQKIDALKCYDNEMRDPPHPRSYDTIHALAKLRGSQAALDCAEAFTCLRDIQE